MKLGAVGDAVMGVVGADEAEPGAGPDGVGVVARLAPLIPANVVGEVAGDDCMALAQKAAIAPQRRQRRAGGGDGLRYLVIVRPEPDEIEPARPIDANRNCIGDRAVAATMTGQRVVAE